MSTPLAPDDPDSYESDLEAMRRDAAEWNAAAERMAEVADAAGQLTLADDELSIFGAQSGLNEAYRQAQQWVSGLLAGAARNLADMGQALTASAETYQAPEASGARSFDQLDRGGN